MRGKWGYWPRTLSEAAPQWKVPAAWDTVVEFLIEHAWGTSAAVLTLLCAAIATYARDQVRDGTNWALAPITRALPWNRGGTDPTFRAPLFSELTLVDVFLLDVAGTLARYQKTSCYVADREVVLISGGRHCRRPRRRIYHHAGHDS